ncbi:MAG: pitrilysin family protein [Patescibacteria group bacterium]
MASKLFNKTTLKNGLRIITVPKEDSLAATVLVLVEAGSKYETKNINGLSHFLEHMCFKGTANRPTALKISAELDGIGAEYNAFTSQEWTGYYAKAQAEHHDKILDVISDLYLNPIFDPKEIEKEKGVVIEELNMYEDMPQRKVQDLFLELLYGDQPAGWDVGGKKEIIRTLNREDFLKYRQQHYVAKATILVIAGAVNGKGLLAKIDKHFKNISSEEKHGKVKTKESQKKSEILVRHKESDQTHLVLGCRAFDAFDERRHALEVLADILGGGMSSRLFQRVREQMGAAYYVNAGTDLFSDHGYLAVSAGVDHTKINAVIKAILEELAKIKENSISEQELRRAKDHLTGKLILGLETSDALALFYGGQEVLRRSIMSPEELLKAIQSVSRKDIVNVANSVFQNSKLNLAIIGPYKNKTEFEKILKF